MFGPDNRKKEGKRGTRHSSRQGRLVGEAEEQTLSPGRAAGGLLNGGGQRDASVHAPAYLLAGSRALLALPRPVWKEAFV